MINNNKNFEALLFDYIEENHDQLYLPCAFSHIKRVIYSKILKEQYEIFIIRKDGEHHTFYMPINHLIGWMWTKIK